MKSYEFITESAVTELTKRLPKLKKFDYDSIDVLMRDIASKHNITGKELHDMFVKKYKMIPDDWVKRKSKKLKEDITPDLNNNKTVQKFINMCIKKLDLQTKPNIEFSYDTEVAQNGHHTGRHTPHDGKIWVYAKNRNLVDILRTVAHELRHLSQGEKGLIKPNSSYPGSPIEVDADAWAGMIIKVFGKDNREIFQ